MPATPVIWSDAEVLLTLGPNESDDGTIYDIYMNEGSSDGIFIRAHYASSVSNESRYINYLSRLADDFTLDGAGSTSFSDRIVIQDEWYDTLAATPFNSDRLNNLLLDYDSSATDDLLIFGSGITFSNTAGNDRTDADATWDGTNYLVSFEDNGSANGARDYELFAYDDSGNVIDTYSGADGTVAGGVATNQSGDMLAVMGDLNGDLRVFTVDPDAGSSTIQVAGDVLTLGGSNAVLSDIEVMSLTNGNFVASYATRVTTGTFGNQTSVYRIETVILDAAGAVVSGPTQVATATFSGFIGSSVTAPTVQALTDGGFLVAYDNNFGLGDTIVVQRYDNAGVAVGGPLTLAGTTSTSLESGVEMFQLSDGRVQVAWRETDSGGVERLVTQIIDYRDQANENMFGDLIGTIGDDVAEISGENSALLNDGDDVLNYDITGVDANSENILLDGGDGRDRLIFANDMAVHIDSTFGLNTGSDIVFDNMGTPVDIGVIRNFEEIYLGDQDDDFGLGVVIGSRPTNDGTIILSGGAGDDRLEVTFGNQSAQGAPGANIYGDAGNDTIIGESFGFSDILYGGNINDGAAIVADDPFGIRFNLDGSNTDRASAISLNEGFSLAANGGIVDSTTIPHVTMNAIANGTGSHIYSLQVGVTGTSLIVDIDNGNTGTTATSESLLIGLFNSDGDLVDSAAFGAIDPGSVTTSDPYLETDGLDAGLYFIMISGPAPYSTLTLDTLAAQQSLFIPNGVTYTLNVSVDEGTDDDTIFGQGGDDYIEGGRGADTMDGGDDIDTLGYRQSDTGVTVNLEFNVAFGGHATGDTIVNFENVDGSNFADSLTGDAGANVLRGFGGVDVLVGGGGDDVLDGGLGADTLDGGSGTDTLSLETASAGSIIRLDLGMGMLGDAEGDSYTSIENVIGSSFTDLIQGDAGSNVLQGAGGDDLLVGRGGADVLDGGDGFDTASYFDQAAGVTASLFTGMATGGDTFVSIERLVGSDFNDLLIGRDGASDTLEGGSGNDALRGNGGDDTMLGGDGADLFFSGFGADSHDGGAGIDTISYTQANAGLIVRLDLGQGFFNQAEGDTYTGIENVVGTAFRDALTGDSVANRLEGRAGNDDLFGLAGSDTLLGGNGNDKLDGGTGFDVLTGGMGMDTFVFQAGYQADRITDFTNGDDVIDLTSFGFTSFSQVSALASQQGNDTVINFGNGDAIRLVDFDVADFDANDVMI